MFYHLAIDIQDDKKTIECNTKEQITNCFMEIKNITFEKLNDLEFKNTIQVHDLVWQSGVLSGDILNSLKKWIVFKWPNNSTI
jgi:hypothetical protein